MNHESSPQRTPNIRLRENGKLVKTSAFNEAAEVINSLSVGIFGQKSNQQFRLSGCLITIDSKSSSDNVYLGTVLSEEASADPGGALEKDSFETEGSCVIWDIANYKDTGHAIIPDDKQPIPALIVGMSSDGDVPLVIPMISDSGSIKKMRWNITSKSIQYSYKKDPTEDEWFTLVTFAPCTPGGG